MSELPTKNQNKLPKYPIVPAILLGRLAIDHHYHSQRFGSVLLVDALNHAQDFSEKIGTYAVVVDEINQKAVQFYLKFGFIQFFEHPQYRARQ